MAVLGNGPISFTRTSEGHTEKVSIRAYVGRYTPNSGREPSETQTSKWAKSRPSSADLP